MIINTYDLDGVVLFDNGLTGVRPNPEDVIITGRSYEEATETYKVLHARGIFNPVYFSPIKFENKTRAKSGYHKARVLELLLYNGMEHGLHFEDDPIQIEKIREVLPDIRIVHVKSEYVELENVKRDLL